MTTEKLQHLIINKGIRLHYGIGETPVMFTSVKSISLTFDEIELLKGVSKDKYDELSAFKFTSNNSK